MLIEFLSKNKIKSNFSTYRKKKKKKKKKKERPKCIWFEEGRTK